jgi:hypothetical protein
MGWVRPLFRHRKYKVPADSKLLKIRFLPDFLPLDRGWCSWKMRQCDD